MPIRTGISAQQGIISISETSRNHIGQDLGNTGVEAKHLLFLSSKPPYLFRRHEQGHCHVEDGNVQNQ